jgi:urocanate hydratase
VIRARARVDGHARARAARHADRGTVLFDYGNNLRGEAERGGLPHELAFSYPGLRARVHPAAVLRRQGPVPLGRALGRSGRHPRHRRAALAEFPDDARLHRWIPLAQRTCSSRACPPASAGWATASVTGSGLRFNQLVREGKVKARSSSARPPRLRARWLAYRETEAMRDGSDAVADWPLLNALLNTASGASWVSIHHGGGVGIGNSIHAGMVIVCDGSAEADRRLERVLTNDPGTGVMRHADAGYTLASEHARRAGMNCRV